MVRAGLRRGDARDKGGWRQGVNCCYCARCHDWHSQLYSHVYHSLCIFGRSAANKQTRMKQFLLKFIEHDIDLQTKSQLCIFREN